MDGKEIYTKKVENYIKFRPTYPDSVVEYLLYVVGLKKAIVADIGAGSGILTKQIMSKVSRIYAIEPNSSMRKACEKNCALDKCIIVDGCAEDTNLQDKSVDFITVAQAFHWFDKELAKTEFKRILKTGGKVILIWNAKDTQSKFIKENDDLCRRLCSQFAENLREDTSRDKLNNDFFKGNSCEYRFFKNNKSMSLQDYIGVSLSSSYAPNEEDRNYYEFIDKLKEIFNKYSKNEIVDYPYITDCYVGEI